MARIERVGVLLLLLSSGACGARAGLLAGDDGATMAGDAGSADPAETPDASDTSLASVAAPLDGVRWELPCTPSAGDAVLCQTLPSVVTSGTMGGAPGAVYDVTLRFRGVEENNTYVGGRSSGHWQVGGSPPADSVVNVYGLDVSSPWQQFFLNEGASHGVVAIDYTETVRIAAGATVTLRADSRDSYELRNVGPSGQPFAIPGVASAPFDGQFLQMDVVSVAKVDSFAP